MLGDSCLVRKVCSHLSSSARSLLVQRVSLTSTSSLPASSCCFNMVAKTIFRAHSLLLLVPLVASLCLSKCGPSSEPALPRLLFPQAALTHRRQKLLYCLWSTQSISLRQPLGQTRLMEPSFLAWHPGSMPFCLQQKLVIALFQGLLL